MFFFLYPYFEGNHTTYGRLYTYVLLLSLAFPMTRVMGMSTKGPRACRCPDQWEESIPSVLVGKPDKENFWGRKRIDVLKEKVRNMHKLHVENRVTIVISRTRFVFGTPQWQK